jgi:hypothetical protein
MPMMQIVLSGVATLFVYAMIVAGVTKLFQIATDLGEIKDALNEIRRNTQDAMPPALVRHSPGRLPEPAIAQVYSPAPAVAQPDAVESPRELASPLNSN